MSFPWTGRPFAVPLGCWLEGAAVVEMAPGPVSEGLRSSMADGRPFSRGSLVDPLPTECMLPSLDRGSSRVYEPTLERGPFREYALPFFRSVNSCRSF